MRFVSCDVGQEFPRQGGRVIQVSPQVIWSNGRYIDEKLR